ncbi:MAG: nucleoside/nucleotide kinase family protein [Candidatus Nanopelagicaceae bacterium]|nr:nucleoside/nucleotide kinase family protein [Candidatus Nanopelagicaceae bacterium]
MLTSIEAVVSRARSLMTLTSGERKIVGLIGKPGAGKSTLSAQLIEQLGDQAAILNMDGYHLSNLALRELGRADRKGAPDTFDALGFTEILKRVKNEVNQHIYFPVFDRSIEESIAAQGVITPQVKLVITEGNYLLRIENNWGGVKELLDESWFIEVDDQIRIARLVNRHHKFGKSKADAHSWATGSDENNARIVAKTRELADVIINLS